MQQEASLSRMKFIIICLSLLGLALSSVALWEHVVYVHGLAQGQSFCNISARFNCEAVNASEWSLIFGLPVASYGIFFYLAAIISAIYSGPSGVFSPKGFAGLALLGGVISSVGSLVLLGISEFIIGSLCLICMGMYLTNFLILATAIILGRGISVSERLATIAGEIGSLFSGLMGGGVAKAARVDLAIYAVCLLAIGVVSFVSPEIALSFAPSKKINITPPDPVAQWESGPLKEIPLSLDKGTFGDFVKGAADAPITIVEFADFECPACRRLYVNLKPLLAKYEGRYRLVFKNYPLDNACNPEIKRSFHQYACLAAFASRCAGEQGKYWEGIDFLFTYDGLEGAGETMSDGNQLVRSMAASLEIDEEALSSCVSSGRYAEVVRKDIEAGSSIDLQGTPTLIINGKKAPYNPLTSLEAVFNKILAAPSR